MKNGSPRTSTEQSRALDTSEARRANMRAVRAKNTKPEMIVRKIVHSLGFRFRLHGRDLPGKPDLVLKRHRAVIFVHGCFWHGHEGCNRSRLPATNTPFWTDKLGCNVERDRRQQIALWEAGWRVLIVWECELRDAEACRAKLSAFLKPEQEMPKP